MKAIYALLLVALSAVSSYGQGVLFKPLADEEVRAGLVSAQRVNLMNGLKGYKKLHYVRVGDLKSAQKKGQLEFTLPNQLEPIRAKAVRVEAKDASNFKWFGETESGESILLISQGDTVFGHIASPTKRYNLIGLDKKLSALAEIDPAAFPGADCATPKPIREVKGSTKPANASGRMGPQSCINPIRILILSTQAARGLDPNIQQTARTAVEQFNGAVSSSRIDDRATLQYAGYVPIDFEETNDIARDIVRLATLRPDIEQIRVNAQADIVVLLTFNDYPLARGIARQIEANRAGAYAISKVGAAANNYTLAHEVGHIFGGIHENSDGTTGSIYAQGKRFDVRRWPFVYRYSTIMHTWVPESDDYSRVLRFSNPNVTYNGVSTGDAATANVARKINERIAAVADFEPTPNILTTYVQGRSSIANGEVATWESIYSCGQPGYTFEWAQSEDGFAYQVLATTENYTGTFSYRETFLRLRVTSADGQVAESHSSVFVGGGSGGQPRKNAQNSTEQTASGLEVIYPNPSDEQAQVRYSLGAACSVSFEVVNQVGQTLRVFRAGEQQPGQHTYPINTGDLMEGNYTLKMAAADVVQSKHLLILRKK